MGWESTVDRQDYHNDGTLHIVRKVPGTDILILIGPFRQTHTHTQSQIVAYRADTFTANNLNHMTNKFCHSKGKPER